MARYAVTITVEVEAESQELAWLQAYYAGEDLEKEGRVDKHTGTDEPVLIQG